ncbi:MAG: hypothetical protein M3361_19100 [Candidatus Tectomicrobia bacterium]|nr:hypothetical protein [Candidatus Tectomicrobia bacterium]
MARLPLRVSKGSGAYPVAALTPMALRHFTAQAGAGAVIAWDFPHDG